LILDLPRFLHTERPYWEELQKLLDRLEAMPDTRLSLEEMVRLHYLYQRASSALTRLSGFAGELEVRQFLESLVARAYAEFHPSAPRLGRFRPIHWFLVTFPRTFRKRFAAFALSLALTVGGTIFGAAAIAFDHDSKSVLMPFSELNEDPAQRVQREESEKGDHMSGHKDSFAAQLMTHNIGVSLFTFALGMTWGVGSIFLLFYNGVTLGAVALDYIGAGQIQFLFGWLMPHGVIEIPAIMVAGQAAFVLASALIGFKDSTRRSERLRESAADMLTLAGGACVMLVWAGIIEAFFSQYHAPVLPYNLKIAFGLVELLALCIFLARAGRSQAN
jgi:uncharacterized membrane protein SpoIIM required for sporulation